MLQGRGVSVEAGANPDWYLIAGSFIPLAGVGFALICYLATTRRRKWLRLAAIVMGIMGAAMMALWLLPNVASYSRFETLSVPEGISVFLAIIACLIVLTSSAVAWRRELSGSILMIGGGLIAGVAYPLWLFHTASILTLFPLLSGLLFLLSWRERPVPIKVEALERAPSPVQTRIGRSYTPVIFGIGAAGFISLLPVLSNVILLPYLSYIFSVDRLYISWWNLRWELYFILLYTEAWCLAITCSILAVRKYW